MDEPLLVNNWKNSWRVESLPKENLVSREEALKLWTLSNTWFSNEEGIKGEIKEGLLADFAVLSADYFSVDDEEIKDITSVMTILGGEIVHGSGGFSSLAPKLPAPMPDWSPVRYFGVIKQETNTRDLKPWKSNPLAALFIISQKLLEAHLKKQCRIGALAVVAGRFKGKECVKF